VTHTFLLKGFVFTSVTYPKGHLDYCGGHQKFKVTQRRK